MSKFGGCRAIVVAMFLTAGACSSKGDAGKSPGTGGASGSGMGGIGFGAGGTGGSGIGGNGAGGTGGKDAGSSPDASVCCPPDPLPIVKDSVHLGGAASRGGVCYVANYPYPSCLTNWRLEADDQGCPILRVDYTDCPQARNDARPPDAHDAASDTD